MRKVIALACLAVLFLLIPARVSEVAATPDLCVHNCFEGCMKCTYVLPYFLRIMQGNFSTFCDPTNGSNGACDCCTSYPSIGVSYCQLYGEACFGLIVEPSPAG